MRASTSDAPTCCLGACVCTRACVWVWAHPQPRRTVQALSVGVDRVRLGSQAFYLASAFNANIGAWNTAAVTTLSYVRAAFGRRRAPRATLSLSKAIDVTHTLP
jgi:hypothetical protein